MFSLRSACGLTAASCTGLLAAVGPASADLTAAAYINNTTYNYKLVHMPDWDQRRNALGNTGNMYCAPTATMNLFAYAANHGFPGTNPGPGTWLPQGQYNAGSIWLVLMGINMGTHPTDGTGGGWGPGAALFASGSFMTTQRYSNNSNYTATIGKMTKKAIQGSVVAFNYGKYKRTGFNGSIPIVTRTGGHVVTLTESLRSGSSRTLRFRDPWTGDDDSLSNQSSFANKTVNPVTKTFQLSGAITNREVITEGTGSDGNYYYRIFESFLTCRPFYGIQFLNTGDSAATTLQTVVPQWFSGSPLPPTTLNVPTGHELHDVAFNFDEEEAIVITKTGAIAVFFNLGRIDILANTYAPIPTPIQPAVMCVGRNNAIFISDGGKIHRIDQDGQTEVATSNTPIVSRMAYNDENDELVVLSIPNRQLVRFNQDLGVIATFNVPTAVPMGGSGWLTVSRETNRVWFCTSSSNNLFGFIFGSGPIFSQQTINNLGLVSPQGLSSDDEGKLYVTSQGIRRVLKRNPDTNVWAFDLLSPFHGQPGGGQFAMNVSRTNLAPGAEDGPEFVNIELTDFVDEPEEILDCVADLNSDGQVTAADLSILLAGWGSKGSPADLNGSGSVDAADLAVLLASWGACAD